MTISRANMKSQMKGSKMKKKKPVIKANVGKFLENVSPAYSIMKGKGPISDAFSKLGESGLGGIAGMLAKEQRDKRSGSEKVKAPQPMGMKGATPMYGGGAVKRKRPIDGIATKGKTRGKYC